MTNPVFELFAKLGMDSKEFDKGLGDAKSKAGKLGAALKSGLGAAAKAAGVAVAAAGTALVKIGKDAVASYAEFEQLAGGIETLYGRTAEETEAMRQSMLAAGMSVREVDAEMAKMGDSSDKMMKYASEAWKTAGMSANQYMDTAIQSSAAMISSLGGDTEKAAELMNMSIIDMSDNVNKMGTDMEAIQNAYRGFSRGNFTMLDNLALGFAGTKEGMEQLLAKAKEVSGVTYDISSYADIVQAIHVVQTEMGITGTTAKEASETIAGSLNAAKAAYQNLLTGIADDNADFDSLVGNFVESVKTAGDNLIPRIKTTVKGLGKLVKEIVPVIAAELPGIVNDVLPDLLSAAVDLIVALSEAFAENAPMIIDTLVNALVNNAPKLIEAGIKLVLGLVEGLFKSLPSIATGALEIIGAFLGEISNAAFDILEAGASLVTGLWEGIKSMGEWIGEKVSDFFGGIVDGVKGLLGIASPSKVFAGIGNNMALGIGEGFDDAIDGVSRKVEGATDDLTARVSDMASGMDYNASVTGGAVEHRFSGTIRVEGVSDDGEFSSAVDLIYDDLVTQLRRERRFA